MPSLKHNALVDLFRENPDLAPDRLKKDLGIDVPEYAEATVSEATLDQLLPIEYRSDLVVELNDKQGKPVLCIIVEVQLSTDTKKLYSWPAYATVLRARKRCRVCVLVVTPDPKVAAWAAKPIDLGPSNEKFNLLVLGPKQVPRITDPVEARKNLELSILSALAYGNEPDGLDVVMAAFSGLDFDNKTSEAYLYIIHEALNESMRRALEEILMEYQEHGEITLPPFAQKLIARGEIRGRTEGMLAGEARGRTEERQRILFQLLEQRFGPLTDEERKRIEEADAEELFSRLFNAQTLEELF